MSTERQVGPGALISVAEHRSTILSAMGVTQPIDLVGHWCVGAALAADVVARVAVPTFTNSAMDGYAVRAADVARVPVRLAVTADIPAGRPSVIPLTSGTAQRIMTGAPLPDGADAVVRVEWTDAGMGEVRIGRSVPVGQDVRFAGEDVLAGAVVARVGQSVSAGLLGASAAIGVGQLTVHRRPRVVVVSTGDELAVPGADLGAGMIYESNSRMLEALVGPAGGEVVDVATLTDDIGQASRRLQAWAAAADVIITTGGVSAGAFEVVKQACEEVGTVEFVKVAVQPGKPQGFGLIGMTPIITLPGNPVSAFVSFELFARPALRALGGHAVTDRPAVTLVLTEPVRRSPDRHRYIPARADLGAGTVAPTAKHGSHMVTAVAEADALISISAGHDQVFAGEPCEVMLLL
ncbi:MAG: gephyrin-like molybdotransferase Glp [Actinomycetes bacterium]